MDQGSTRKRSAVHNFAPTVTKFCVMWEGQALPHDTKFGNSRCEIVGRRVIFIWSLIHGSSWSGLIKVGPGSSEVHRRTDKHKAVSRTNAELQSIEPFWPFLYSEKMHFIYLSTLLRTPWLKTLATAQSNMPVTERHLRQLIKKKQKKTKSSFEGVFQVV